MTANFRNGSRPAGRPIMQQTWNDLLFASWPVPDSFLRAMVPPNLDLDHFEGRCWITITPLEMCDVGLTTLPSVFAFKPFLELNLRTYVIHEDTRGVFFFSLDTNNTFVARMARRWYHLPYFESVMSMQKGESIAFSSSRRGTKEGDGVFGCSYFPRGESFQSTSGSLEEWLTERYALFTSHGDNQTRRAAIHHPRWTLFRADAVVNENTLPYFPRDPSLPGKPLFLYSQSLKVDVWSPQQMPN